MIRLGLCCTFRDEPIRFRTATATAVQRLAPPEAARKLAGLCAGNAAALLQALRYCSEHGIGCFRVNSQILPLKTHPDVGYRVEDLPGGAELIEAFRACRRFAESAGLRTTFHPDQFVVLNSPRTDVLASSLKEIEYQAEVAQWIGADVINIHAGGAYGDKPTALERFARNLSQLSDAARKRLTVENDDKTFTPSDLLPVCRAEGIPLVYDVHHHRCNPDVLDEATATRESLATWDREPLVHISSPLDGWNGSQRTRHDDYIDIRDFPIFWQDYDLTVEVEAKAKELAVRRLAEALAQRRVSRRGHGL